MDIIYTVKGRGDFPVDMLRVDGCCPWSDNDSYQIVNSLITREVMGEKMHSQDHYEICLMRPNITKDWKPNEVFWNSFRWTVTATCYFLGDNER